VTQVKGEFSLRHVCDQRCTSAVGPVCQCSCGGANHQADWAGISTWRLTFNGKVVESTPEMRKAVFDAKAAKREAARVEQEARWRARQAEWNAAHPQTNDATPRQIDYLTMLLVKGGANADTARAIASKMTKTEASARISELLS
jgi:outer membrane murein-binding lipoprotein Lpp